MKRMILRTKRLVITPMTEAELAALAERIPEAELKAAYGEMLGGVRAHPAEALWYTLWKIALKEPGKTDTMIGSACFKGSAVRGAVEIGYGMEYGWDGHGYMTEAVKALTEWALTEKDVYAVTAETAPENRASQRVLEKVGFAATGDCGEEGPRFRLDRPKAVITPAMMLFGLSVGLAFGAASERMGAKMCLGLCVGMLLGILLDRRERKHRAAVTGENE